MKVFLISYPFEDELSGDFDYCSTMVKALEKRQIKAEYLKGKDLTSYDADNTKRILDILLEDKNTGGSLFYKSLNTFYEDDYRKSFSLLLKNHLLQKKAASHNILNLQLRPPETGFIFSPEDLVELKTSGFKVCVTCHEYKLNYTRRWLQSILHPYFQVADRVFFFNEKDMSNAIKHANRSSFLDDLITSGPLNPDYYQGLSHKFSSKSHLSLSARENNTLFVTKQELTELKCDLLIGEITSLKGSAIKFQDRTHKIHLTHPFKFDWGIKEQLKISSKQENKFLVSGTIINPELTPEITSITTKLEDYFSFNHPAYNLKDKAVLSRVPPTTADINRIEEQNFYFRSKKPNIIIFGLIRESKGFEDALEIIEEIHTRYRTELPTTRLIIAGKPNSLKLLATIINKKFSCGGTVTFKMLEEIIDPLKDHHEITDKIINAMLDFKLTSIKKSLQAAGSYSEGIERQVLESIHKKPTEELGNHSKLQYLVHMMAQVIPEYLPIDIFLNISSENLHHILLKTKYAIKYDEKGWANNSSGLINLLASGCILYTHWGMCTPKEVTHGPYKGAIVLPKTKYCLKHEERLTPDEEAEGKRKCFVVERKVSEKHNFIKTQTIVKDIIAREQETSGYFSEFLISEGDNQITLNLATSLIAAEFHPETVATRMVHEFNGLFDALDIG